MTFCHELFVFTRTLKRYIVVSVCLFLVVNLLALSLHCSSGSDGGGVGCVKGWVAACVCWLLMRLYHGVANII